MMMICLMEHATEDWLHPHLLQHLPPSPHTLYLCVERSCFFKAKRVLRRREEKRRGSYVTTVLCQ